MKTGKNGKIYLLTSSNNKNRGRFIACSKKMKDCGALCCSTWHPWFLVPGTYGMHQTKKQKFPVYQHGLQGAEFRSLQHMECITPKKDISWYASRVVGCRIQVPRTYGMHQTGNKRTVPLPSEHLGRLKMSYHTLPICRELPM